MKVDKPEANYAVRVWFSTPENIEWFKESAGAYYELPPEETRLMTLVASNDKQARKGIEEMLARKMPRDRFEIVDIRRLN